MTDSPGVEEFARTPRVAVDIDLPPTLDRLRRSIRETPRVAVDIPYTTGWNTEHEEGR